MGANTDVQRAGRMVESMVARDAHHCGRSTTRLAVKLQAMGLDTAAIRQYRKRLFASTGEF